MDGPVSRIEWVEDQLRRALLSGDFKPGERLLTAQLSERFQVSPTPLREALHRLSGEGLVEFVPQRGARVTDLSHPDGLELTGLRELLEPSCVSDAIAHGHDEWLDDVETASATLIACWQASPHDPRASELAYQMFYEKLTSTCASNRLRRYASAIRDQQARYRLATIGVVNRGELQRVHSRLKEAVREADTHESALAVLSEIRFFATGYAQYEGNSFRS